MLPPSSIEGRKHLKNPQRNILQNVLFCGVIVNSAYGTADNILTIGSKLFISQIPFQGYHYSFETRSFVSGEEFNTSCDDFVYVIMGKHLMFNLQEVRSLNSVNVCCNTATVVQLKSG